MKSQNASNGRTVLQATLVASVAGLAVATLVAAAMLVASPRQATATQAYAQQTGQPCGKCHANPGGGGKLKPFGEKFQAKGHKL
jgi:hypothetical protein